MPSASLSVHMDMAEASDVQDHVRSEDTPYDNVSQFLREAARNQMQRDMANQEAEA